MEQLFPIYVAAFVLVLLGVSAIWRVRHEFRTDGHLSIGTTILVWAVYLFHAGLTGYVAWRGFWLMPIPTVVAQLVGSVILVAGLLIAGAGIREFRSISRVFGRDEGELVTTGIYRWSRNPQNTGWILALIGGSILGGSTLALVLVSPFALLIHVYLLFVEEPHLSRVFGPTYQRYRTQTPRYLGCDESRTHS